MGPYDRRLGFGRPEDIPRGFDYSIQRYSNGGPRGYHGDDSRGYYTDGAHRNLPRRDDPHSYYREPRDELHLARQLDLRHRRAVPPSGSVRAQGLSHHLRALPTTVSACGDDSLMQAILSLDRGEHRDSMRRKPLFPPQRERSPFRKEVPHSPHSRSGSSLSSRSYSPDRSKCFTYQTQQRKRHEESFSQGRELDKDRPSSYSVNGSRDGSPLSSASTSKVSVDKAARAVDPSSPDVLAEKVDKPLESSDSAEARVDCEEPCLLEAEHEEEVLNKDDPAMMNSNYAERRSEAIAAKAREIEKVYRRDCETFGMVVKMLVAKEPSLESMLQNPLRENLSEIRERCLEDLKHFIYELDEAVLRS